MHGSAAKPTPKDGVQDRRQNGVRGRGGGAYRRTTRMPRPPPPIAALSITGYPASAANALAASTPGTGSDVPGTTFTPASMARLRAAVLSPSRCSSSSSTDSVECLKLAVETGAGLPWQCAQLRCRGRPTHKHWSAAVRCDGVVVVQSSDAKHGGGVGARWRRSCTKFRCGLSCLCLDSVVFKTCLYCLQLRWHCWQLRQLLQRTAPGHVAGSMDALGRCCY